MIVLLVLIGAGVLMAPAPPAWACSCAVIDPVAMADVAFAGRVLSIGQDTQGGGRRVEFAVESVLKGSVGSSVVLTTSASSASCGFDFAVGHRYRVFAESGRTGLCSGNVELPAGFASPFLVTGSMRPAVVWPQAGVYEASSWSRRAVPIGIATILLAGAVIYVLRRRRHR
jgi:hypothetical protein